MSEKNSKAERRVQSGELEKVQASEEVGRRNALAVLAQLDVLRKAILEMAVRIDTLQKNMMNQQQLFEQQRMQLAKLQQQFYARGSTSYSNGEG